MKLQRIAQDGSERPAILDRDRVARDVSSVVKDFSPETISLELIGRPRSADIYLDLNGEPAQRGNTRTMIFAVDHLFSYTSRFMQLEPGDVITTDTPPGVGMGRKPPLCLKAGDRMLLGIQGLGEQNQKVAAR